MPDSAQPLPFDRAMRLARSPYFGKNRRRRNRRGSGYMGRGRQIGEYGPWLEDKTTVIEAHILGQSMQRRGLRAGPVGLVIAKTAYLTIQWSGSQDRRAQLGKVTQFKV
jgi:hypothetical protein